MQNTSDAFQYAINEWNEHDGGRNLYFVAMLALNQKKFDLALRLIGHNDSLTAINIKLLAKTELNDWKGVCDLLYKIIKNRSIERSYRICADVVSDQQNPNQAQFLMNHFCS